MRPARIIMASILAIAVCTTAAVAQQSSEGMITGINRLSGMIAIQPLQDGTVGSGAGPAAEEFKVQDRSLLEQVHAGDSVTFQITETGGSKTITKLQRKK